MNNHSALRIQIQHSDFNIHDEYQNIRSMARQSGAIVTFSGLVRDFDNQQEIIALELEHYPGMSEKSLTAIAEQACQRWPIDAITIIHRVGHLTAAEQIVMVGTASAHRQAAFDACQFIMDYLKTDAPFWKKETTQSGSRWVQDKTSDQTAKNKWQSSQPSS